MTANTSADEHSGPSGSSEERSENKRHTVYIVRCSDDTLYTGYTTDVKRRVLEHNQQRGAKYTRGRTPVTLVYTEFHPSRSQALKREHEIKALSRLGKLALIQNSPHSDSKDHSS